MHETPRRPQRQGPDRRSLLAGSAAALAGSRMAWAQRRFEGRRITYVSWGGAYQDGQKKAYCDPYTEMTGLRIDQDGPNDYARLRLMVSSGRVVWDVADVGAAFMHGAEQQNLFEKLDYGIIDRNRIDPRYVTDHGVGNIVFSYNLAYSTERFAGDNRPQNWADLWDLRRFPGKRMLNANAPTSLEAALLADGVAPAQLYPLDVARALRKLDQIKEQIIWWETNSQSQQILVSGAATMGLINNGRLYDAVQKGAKLALSWEQAIQSVDYLVIPRGSRNLEPATALIDYVTRPEPQAAFANLMVFSPTNPAAFPLIKPELHGWLATNPAHADKVILQDGAYWRDNLDAVNRRWNAWRLT